MMDAADGHDMSSMDGMMTAEQMDTMSAMTGPEFDQTWLEMMIAHHEGASSQSETVNAEGSNADVLTLADQIITAQLRSRLLCPGWGSNPHSLSGRGV